MNRLDSVGGFVRDIVVALIAIFSFWAWARAGFKFPKYVHWIAIVSAVIGALLALLGYVSDAEHAHKMIWAVFVFPVLTYFLFIYRGGGFIMANREQEDPKKHR